MALKPGSLNIERCHIVENLSRSMATAFGAPRLLCLAFEVLWI